MANMLRMARRHSMECRGRVTSDDNRYPSWRHFWGHSAMKHARRQHWHLCAGALLAALLSPAAAQDVRGLEVCTAEKQMERRTGCLQANVEFLQQALIRLTRETQDRM